MKSYVNDLVAMVGGKAKALAAPAKKEVRKPEDITPLNDDDFSDF